MIVCKYNINITNIIRTLTIWACFGAVNNLSLENQKGKLRGFGWLNYENTLQNGCKPTILL